MDKDLAELSTRSRGIAELGERWGVPGILVALLGASWLKPETLGFLTKELGVQGVLLLLTCLVILVVTSQIIWWQNREAHRATIEHRREEDLLERKIDDLHLKINDLQEQRLKDLRLEVGALVDHAGGMRELLEALREKGHTDGRSESG